MLRVREPRLRKSEKQIRAVLDNPVAKLWSGAPPSLRRAGSILIKSLASSASSSFPGAVGSQVCRTAEDAGSGVELAAPDHWHEPFLLPTDSADPDRPHPPWLWQRPAYGSTRPPGDALHRRWRSLLGRSLCECGSSHPRLGSGLAQVTVPCPTPNIFLAIAHPTSGFYSPPPPTRLTWEG